MIGLGGKNPSLKKYRPKLAGSEQPPALLVLFGDGIISDYLRDLFSRLLPSTACARCPGVCRDAAQLFASLYRSPRPITACGDLPAPAG